MEGRVFQEAQRSMSMRRWLMYTVYFPILTGVSRPISSSCRRYLLAVRRSAIPESTSCSILARFPEGV